jgi:cyclopropane-fatty-acyl-phospholipid synthase
MSSSVDIGRDAPFPPLDVKRWPALVEPGPAPFRAAAARLAMRRAVERAGIHLTFPDGRSLGPTAGPLLEVRRPDAFFARLGREGKIGFGEAYMAGDWDAPYLVDVLEAMARQVDTLVPPKLQWIRRLYEPRHPKPEDNDRDGSRRNIARHYDLSNELFAAFLDESMTYSSALFVGGAEESLAAAQARKTDRLLDATGVGAGSRVLEIGTGWGALAMRAAMRGARVTTVTLSEEQATLARQRIARAGLTSAVDVRIEDYRDVTGQFDAVLSVEMIEAVGERWWPEYFRTLEKRLAPSGRIGLQAILMAHDRLLATKGSWTWIHKYIFPGGVIPSTQAIRQTLSEHTKLEVIDQLNFGESYAITLRRWRDLFDAREERIDQLGFDRTFRRMWDFYLAYSEAGFRSGYLDVAQLVLARGALPSGVGR